MIIFTCSTMIVGVIEFPQITVIKTGKYYPEILGNYVQYGRVIISSPKKKKI